MFFKKLKEALTPSLSTLIGRQVSSHKRGRYTFHNDIIAIISSDYDGPYISAALKSTDPSAGGISASDQIWFYKYRVSTFVEAFNRLTYEVSGAKVNYPNLNFFRSLQIPEEYTAELLTDWSTVNQDLKAKMVKEGCDNGLNQEKNISIYEIYSGGTWAQSNGPSYLDETDVLGNIELEPSYQKMAEQGDVEAQFKLGIMYQYGYGVTPDDKQAVEWYQKAAEQDYAEAQYFLGLMYADGNGVTKDVSQAVKWYQKAADQGDAEAQSNLVAMIANGRGAAQDDGELVAQYQTAAEQGDAKAQYNFGKMYKIGRGVTKDYKQALMWYQKSAEQGYAIAQFNLGIMYHNGQGVTKDYKQAVVWYQKAAEQGYVDAQFNLGLMYFHGQGVTQDYVQALMWWNIADLSGYSRAVKNSGIVAKRMTSSQIQEAQNLAAQWMDKGALDKVENENASKSKPALPTTKHWSEVEQQEPEK